MPLAALAVVLAAGWGLYELMPAYDPRLIHEVGISGHPEVTAVMDERQSKVALAIPRPSGGTAAVVIWKVVIPSPLFAKGPVSPLSGAALAHPGLYATLAMNPADNAVNLPPGYLDELAALPELERLRFLEGRYAAALAGALWTPAIIERQLVAPAEVPDLARIVVAVDPSGCSGPEDLRSDEIGIVAAGRDGGGLLYVLEDASGRFSPEGWARAALGLYDRLGADRIVAERNFGGGMVEHTLRAVRPGAPVHMVRASRAKAQRAEPVAALYEQGRVRHAGRFPVLEEQLMAFSTAGYQGQHSPDRADAAIWALTDLIETEIRPGARVLPNL